MERLESRIDPESINKDEFSEIFKSCYLIIARTHQKRKLQAAANIISNALLREKDPERLDFTELDFFCRCVESISIGAIEVLQEIVRISESNAETRNGGQNFRLDFGWVARRLPKYQPDFLMGLLRELNTYNLIELMGAPSVRTANYGNYPIELPSLGVRFITHIVAASREVDAD